ncbi:hypothetical protein VUR80DRAFT_9755 [Thermomyces stellatus]
MRLFPAIAALLPLAAANLHPRQARAVEIIDTNPVGPGCPANTLRKAPSNSTSDATVSFDAYESVLGAGTPNAERDVHCQIFVTLRFPQGCTAAAIETTYRGTATVSDGASGVVAPSYRLTGGELDVGENAPSFFEGAEFADGGEYEKTDEVVAKVEVDEDEGREVRFVVRSRTFIQTVGEEGGAEGSITSDDIRVVVKSLESC